MDSLSNPQQRPAHTLALSRWQDVQLIDPSFAKGNDANEFMVVQATPKLAGCEQTLPEKPPILLWGVESGKRRQGMVEGTAMNRCRLIHVCKTELPQHLSIPSGRTRSPLCREVSAARAWQGCAAACVDAC